MIGNNQQVDNLMNNHSTNQQLETKLDFFFDEKNFDFRRVLLHRRDNRIEQPWQNCKQLIVHEF